MMHDDQDEPIHSDPVDPGAEEPINQPAQRQRNEIKTSPVGRQAVTIGLIAVVFVILALVAKSRAQNNGADSNENNALNPNQVEVSKAAAEAVELKTQKVRMEPGAYEIHTNGVVHFSPYSTINVSPKPTGRIKTVFVKVGDRVEAQQPLAEFVSSDAANAIDTARDADEQVTLTSSALDTARKQFAMGTPEVTAAEANLVQAQENTQYTKRMLDLTREQNGIGGFTDKPLTDAQSAAKQADTQLSQDQKDLALAQTQYDREVKLLGYGVAAKADVETAEDVLGKAKDAVENDNEQSRIAHLTLTRETKAFDTKLYANQTIRQAETAYQQAVIQERAAGTAVRMAKAAVVHDLKQAEHDFRTASADARAAHNVLITYDHPSPEGAIVIRAPAAGVVTARNVNPGQMVDQTGQTPWQMFTIVNAKTVYVDAQIYEKDMIGLKLGERVTVTSEVLPAHFSANGEINYVSPGLDPTTHALSVRAQLDNKAGLLKDGMFVSTTLDIPAGLFPPTPIIPLTAVIHDGDDDYVFVAQGNGKYDRRQVVLGDQRGESDVAIKHGLTGNETIVTHGAIYLGAGGTDAD